MANTTNMVIKIIIILISLSVCMAVEVKEIYNWKYVNYTWPNSIVYQYNFYTGQYIPENNLPATIKIHGDRVYIALGRYYPGTPVTLGYFHINDKNSSPLITPYPSWEMNVESNCNTLQNVNSFDIDKHKVMWILDGLRHNGLSSCPAKLILFDMSANKVLSSYQFPAEGDYNPAFTNIVIDGNFAYISDSNDLDPGIIIYSKTKNTSWKLRDRSMFADPKGLKFSLGKETYTYYHNVGPITVSPENTKSSKKNRFIYYSPVSSLNIYKLNVNVIQNVDMIKDNSWRGYVHVAGTKANQSYYYNMNRNGDMYFCLLNKNALAKWDVDRDFGTATYVTHNKMIDWCSGGSIYTDYLYLLSGNLGTYLITNSKPSVQKNMFRIIRVEIKSKRKN